MATTSRTNDPVALDPQASAELRQRVVLHLAACRPDLAGLAVLVADGTVTLRGPLPTFFLRQLAVERTRHVAGVRQLVDQIEVTAIHSGPERKPK